MQAEKMIRSLSVIPDYRIERILYATDLSSGVEEALDYAITLALTFDAKLFIFNCAEPTVWDMRESEYSRIQEIYRELIGESVSPTDPPVLRWEGIVGVGD